jgi:predicted aminopeptidase
VRGARRRALDSSARTAVHARRMKLRPLVALAALLPLSGCYLLESARGQLDLNSRRVPIATLLAAPSTPAALRPRLELAAHIRDFASTELRLPNNGSYRSYADVGRPYVAFNVFATPEFSVDPKTWCFPVAGCIAYRGYFSEAHARAFALGLEAEGYDVTVGNVPAYSTLGHFDDPVLNTMLGWDDIELAALVFHELAHQLLYVKNDSAFNESFATVVENEGVRRWLQASNDSGALAAHAERQARERALGVMVAAARVRLRALYARQLPPAEMRAAKRAELARLKEEYTSRRAELGSGYEWLFGARLNNALLVTVATYEDCVPGLQRQLRALDDDLPRFYAEAHRLARLPYAARHAAVCTASAAPAEAAAR